MNREDFIKKCTLLGLGAYLLPTVLTSCKKKDEAIPVNFNGSVLVIGAGAAGMIAAYTLRQHNIDFQVLEAGSDFGGRVRKIEGFADFPIDLGAEWIHTKPDIFSKLIKDDSVEGSIDVITYRPREYQVYRDGRLRNRNYSQYFYSEYKFKSTTWYDFFDQYIVPTISDRMHVNSPVAAIDYSGSKVRVTTTNGTVYEADKVICTVPVPILRSNAIAFTPALPAAKTAALEDVDVPPGIKVFVEFSERFYPDLLTAASFVSGSDKEPGLYYDAAFGKDSSRNILGLFWVADEASTLTDLGSDEEVIAYVLADLDTMYDGKASATYIKHVTQNWSAEPYIQGSYSHHGSTSADSQRVADLIEPLDSKVFFAGEAMLDGESATVHGAGFSGYNAAADVLKG